MALREQQRSGEEDEVMILDPSMLTLQDCQVCDLILDLSKQAVLCILCVSWNW
jgi:hypothetical protein